MSKPGTDAAKSNQTSQTLQALFEITRGSKKQKIWIRKDRVVIGTVVSADIRLQGEGVSPIHAVIEFEWSQQVGGCKAKILDLASPAGTFVSGKRVIQAELRPTDELKIGSQILRFSFDSPEAHRLPDQALLLVEGQFARPIFDYRQPAKEALELVYSWNDTILDIQHVSALGQTPRSVVLGQTARSDIRIPALFTKQGEYDLAVSKGKSWEIQLDPKMRGKAYLSGEMVDIEGWIRDKKSSIQLGENDFVKIELGPIQFYLSQTSCPPTLRSNSTPLVTDPFLFKTMVSSLVVTLLTVWALLGVELQNTEVVKVPETIATILYQPEKYTSKPTPKTVVQKEKEKEVTPATQKPKEIDFTKPKEKEGKVAQIKSANPGKKQAAQSQSKQGEGARAKGTEGARGSQNAPKAASKQNAANRPSPEAGQDRGGTKSQQIDNGNVQMLKGASNKILDLLGGSGEKLGKSGSKLQGFGGFATQGQGGMGLQGRGAGGGGTADTLLGGLGEKGRGGGKVGTGLGAEGTGTGIVGGKTRIELRSGGGEETVVVGSIDRDAIDAAIKAHRDEFIYCYDREVNAGNPGLSGKIISAFVIGGSGRASQLAIASSSMGNSNVERCVLNVMSRIQFPEPAGGVPVTIKYPFNFSTNK